MNIARDFIDWKATGYRLQRLRDDNETLRRFVCGALYMDSDKCRSGKGDCANCRESEMDREISRSELAEVFGVTESVIFNWETGRTPLPVEELLFYCKITGVRLEDILVIQR